MPLSWGQMLGMLLRRAPIQQMRQAVALSDENKLDLPIDELEALALTGCDPVEVVEALIFSQKFDIKTTFAELSAVSLAGFNPLDAVKECRKEKEVTFLTISPDSRDHIRALCQDGNPVEALCIVRLKLPAGHLLGFKLDYLHVHLAAKLVETIATSSDPQRLEDSRVFMEDRLTKMAKEFHPTIRIVQVKFMPGPKPSPVQDEP